MTTNLPEIWRLPLRSGKPGVSHAEQIQHCLGNQVAALGWQVTNDGSLQNTLQAIERTYDRRSRNTVKRFASAAVGCLVWTLQTDGTYRVAELVGEWRYDDSPEAERLDCHQVRKVHWTPQALLSSEVPGAVVRSFSQQGSSFSRIHDRIARKYSHRLMDRLFDRPIRVPAPSLDEILHSLLDPFDAEDLVFVYLQRCHGYLVLPGSRRTDSAGYEYVLMHPETMEQAIVQVKTGDSHVDIAQLASAAGGNHNAFAFSTRGLYDGDDPRVVKLSNEDLLTFMANEPDLLPPRVRGWPGWSLRSQVAS